MNDQVQIRVAGIDAIPIHTSTPSMLVRHSISDEELSMLCEKSKDFVQELFWAALGVVVGSLPSALVTLFSLKKVDGNISLTVEGFVHIVFLFVGMSALLITGWLSYRRHKRSTNLETSIRTRTGVAAKT